MSVRSNKAALLSAKSSVGLSWEEGKKKKEQRSAGHCLEIPTQNLNYRIIKTCIVFPEEEIKVKSNPFGLSKVRVKGTLFRILNNPGVSLEPGPTANSFSNLLESPTL